MPTTDRYGRMKPSTFGMWSKTGRKRYSHWSGIVVEYDCNRWTWRIVGTKVAMPTLSLAQIEAESLAGRIARSVGSLQAYATREAADQHVADMTAPDDVPVRVVETGSALLPWAVIPA